MGPAKLTVLFIIILVSLSLPSTSLAGRLRKVPSKISKCSAPSTTKLTKLLWQESPKMELQQEQVFSNVHSRILKVNTNDYGSYNPSPSLSKPPFKLIPN